MISATDQYWSSGRKTCINYSHNLTSWDQSSANDAAVVHPFWLILLMQAFPNDVINGLHPFESHSRSRPLNHQAWGCAQIVLGTGLPSSHLIPLENPTIHSSHTMEYPTTQRHPSLTSNPVIQEYTTRRWYHKIKNTFDHMSCPWMERSHRFSAHHKTNKSKLF